MKKKVVVTIIIISVILVGIGVFNTYNSTPSINYVGDEKGIIVTVDEVIAEDVVNKVEASGEIELIKTVNIYANNSGKISKANFNLGDEVAEGDILLTYDESSIEDLEEQLKFAELDLKSGELAISSTTLPPSEEQVLQLESSIRSRNSEMESAKKQLEQLDLQINLLNDELEGFNNDLSNSEMLLDNGIISKSEYKALEDNIKKVETNLQTLKIDRENALSGIDSIQMAYEDTNAQLNLLKNKIVHQLF